MEIIKEVMINNYKGIEGLQFPCGSINIIVGTNNTGKSSILESIWMGISSLNKLEDEMGTKLPNFIVDYNYKNISFLIREGNQTAKVELKLSDNEKITLELLSSEKEEEINRLFLNYLNKISITDIINYTYRNVFFAGFFYDDVRKLLEIRDKLNRTEARLKEEDSKERLDRLIRYKKIYSNRYEDMANSMSKKFISELIRSKKLFLTSKLNNDLNMVYVLIDSLGEIPILNKEIPSPYKIPLIFGSQDLNQDISDLIKKSINAKILSEVLATLKDKILYFEDVREIKGELFVLLQNLDEPLPISFMGDGFKALIKLSIITPLIKNGVILFEEPETSMHPGYLDILAREIVLNSNASQFFITTHNLELIERILEKAERLDKLGSVGILRLRRLSEGYIEREILSGKEAKEEIEIIKTDLRGY